MKLIHITDIHLVPPGQTLWGLDPFARFDAALDDIATHHGDADFCVITGDLTERGDITAYALLKERLACFPLATHLILGNHDDRAQYRNVFGGRAANGSRRSLPKRAMPRSTCSCIIRPSTSGTP